MKTNVWFLAAAVPLLVALATDPQAGQAGSGPSRSLEQQLLEDLDSDPIDADLQREMRTSKPETKRSAAPEGEKAGEELKLRLNRELGDAAVSEDENPMLDLAQQMQQVQGLVGKAETGEKTQQLQAGIVARLDELLKAARQKQQCKGGQSSSKEAAPRQSSAQPPPKTPGQGKPKSPKTAKAQPGKPGGYRPNMAEMNEVLKRVWGELPEREREQMLELPVEEFLPKYELLIESYFKRLAEEQGREP
jgi:TolA-binding protein